MSVTVVTFGFLGGPHRPNTTPAPVLAIAGQIPRDHIGRGFGTFHEVLDQSSIVQPVTKWRQQALTPREIPAAVSEAFRQMRTGRPRPTLIEIPPEAGVERDDVVLRAPAASSVPDTRSLTLGRVSHRCGQWN